jgi:uncharacterized protein
MLGAAGLGLSWAFGPPLAVSPALWDGRAAAIGALGAVPLLALLLLLIRTRWSWVREIATFIDESVGPIMKDWSLPQLGLISLLAGVGEELLFRGFLQARLTTWWGAVPALVLAAALFGVFHCVTRAYAVAAGVIGAYLGLIFIYSNHILAPIVTHALYDFLALVYFLRLRFANPAAAH